MFTRVRSGRYISNDGEFVIHRHAKPRGRGWLWSVGQWNEDTRDFEHVAGWTFTSYLQARARVAEHLVKWSSRLL